MQQVAFVGDDVLDIRVMKECGVSFAPKDAHELVFSYATHITESHAGNGEVREVADKILLSRFESLEQIYNVLLSKIVADDVTTMEQ